MISTIVTIVAVVLAAIFALLGRIWAGFAYFVLGTFVLLSLFWGVWQIYKYFTAYKKELEERFSIFRVETINEKQISAEYFDENLTAFKKQYSKTLRKEKFFKWFVIAFCFACAILFLLGMIFY